MSNLAGFNAAEVEPSTGYDVIPAGEYEAIITDSEMKPTKNNNGSYLQLTFQLVGGQYDCRFVWARLNLDNPNEQAVEIAQRELSAICRAVGVMTPQDSSELHDIPLIIKVGIEPARGQYSESNSIKAYKSIGEGAAKSAPAATGGAKKAPWKK